ncbi:MAG: hypothetical protein KFF73_11750 [Cyclobacteriaceae bacterium]|nr:hypothetical protein [Cyclobacteriaceae bacterium]
MEQVHIIYFFDPLCLTCFSFRNVLSALMVKYRDYHFDILAGGMVTGNRTGPLSQKSDYLLKKVEAIENTTDTRFGDAYKALVAEGTVISNSEPPSIAFNVFKSFRPDLRFHLAYSLQDLHFGLGMDPNLMKSYFNICEEFGINKFGFMDRFQDPAYKQLTWTLFKHAEAWGIKHFPTLMAESDERRLVIQQGYDSLEVLERAFLQTLENLGNEPGK